MIEIKSSEGHAEVHAAGDVVKLTADTIVGIKALINAVSKADKESGLRFKALLSIGMIDVLMDDNEKGDEEDE